MYSNYTVVPFNTIPITTGDFIHVLHKYWRSPRIHQKYTVVYSVIYQSRPTTLYTIPVTTDDFIHILHNYVRFLRIHQKYMVVYSVIYRS